MIDPKGGCVDIPAYPIRAYYLGCVALGDPGFETKIASRQDIRYRMTAFML